MRNRQLATAWLAMHDGARLERSRRRGQRALHTAVCFFIRYSLARGLAALLHVWRDGLLLRTASRKRRELQRNLARAHQSGSFVSTSTQSEFLAKTAHEARRLRVQKDIAENRRMRALLHLGLPLKVASATPRPWSSSSASAPASPSALKQDHSRTSTAQSLTRPQSASSSPARRLSSASDAFLATTASWEAKAGTGDRPLPDSSVPRSVSTASLQGGWRNVW